VGASSYATAPVGLLSGGQPGRYLRAVRVIGVPYHIDDYLPGLDLPLAPEQVVTVDLPQAEVWARLATLYSAVASAVADATGSGARPVVVSGDCTTSLGTVTGLQRAGLDPGIVWLDAHGDVQTLETTASGYLGGLPLRLLAGYRPELISARLGLRPVPEQRIMLVGARDLDPPEVAYLAQAPIRRAGVTDLGAAELPAGPLYAHVDLDVIDPAEVPGLRYPAPGGPGPAEVADAPPSPGHRPGRRCRHRLHLAPWPGRRGTGQPLSGRRV
jgi:arginase